MKFTTLIATMTLVTLTALAAQSVLDIPLKDINGKDAALKDHKGKVILVVNVASKCGYTKQYTGLEAIHQKYKARGFTVVGMPCNQFGGQEPGTNEQIKEFCSSKFNVTFPLYDKIEVNGANRHPLYTALAGKESPFPGDIKWNFNKFLIGRDGKIIARFDSKVAPESPEMTAAIEKALAAK